MEHLGEQVLANSSIFVIRSNMPKQVAKTSQDLSCITADITMFRIYWNPDCLSLDYSASFFFSNYSLKIYWYLHLEHTAAQWGY